MASPVQAETKEEQERIEASRPWRGYAPSAGAEDIVELPVTCSLGAMGPLLGRLRSLIDTDHNLPQGVSKADLRMLTRDLEEVSTSIMEILKEENPHFTDKLWMKEMRELSYDADDYLDIALSNSGDNKIPWIQAKMKRQLGPQIATDISELRSRLHEAKERRKRYQSVAAVKPKPFAEHVGLEESMNKVVSLLDLGMERNLKVVSFLGVACVGKTTLATRLYHQFGGSFHRRAFLRVSRNPDTRRLLASMLSQIKGHEPLRGISDVRDLTDDIKRYLQDKSYFIVVDDLWDTSVWDIIRRAFPEDNCCSRIITTTQIEVVALASCSYHSDHVFNMSPLNDDQSRQLFYGRIFGSEDGCPKELKRVSYGIIRKCGGLPMAIINIASMLTSWPNFVFEDWKRIQDSFMINPTSEPMKEVLNIVYNNLPSDLKTCLLSLNMYPEDYVIQKDEIVKQWVAEGFFSAVKLQDLQEVAGSYFDELVTRGMIQPVQTNSIDEVLSCTVNDIVLDFIVCKSTEENFITVVNYLENSATAGFPDKVRRLAIKFGGDKSARIPGRFRMSQLRSLVFSGFFRCLPSIVEYRLLQVLILHIWTDQDKTDFNLATIHEMFRLKYLKIQCNMTVKLPANIGVMQYLGALEIEARVTTIPSDIVHLQRLLHLRLPSEIELPHGIDQMTSLRSLGYFNLCTSSRDNVLGLGKLTNLQDLRLTCSAVPSKRLDNNMKRLSSVLGDISNLKSLILDGGSCSGKSISCDGLGGMSPPLVLERLELSPRIFVFSSLPKWIGQLSRLCILKISVGEVSRNDINVLKTLNALTALSLYVRTASAERIPFDDEGFNILKHFKFMCSALCLVFQKGAMPNVRRLKLGFNANRIEQYNPIDAGIDNLTGLEVLSAKIGGASADESGRKAIWSAFVDAFNKRRSHPVINVRTVDMIFYSEKEISRSAQMEHEHRHLEKQDPITRREDKHSRTDRRINNESSESSSLTSNPGHDKSTGTHTENYLFEEIKDVAVEKHHEIQGNDSNEDTNKEPKNRTSMSSDSSSQVKDTDQDNSMGTQQEKQLTLDKQNLMDSGIQYGYLVKKEVLEGTQKQSNIRNLVSSDVLDAQGNLRKGSKTGDLEAAMLSSLISGTLMIVRSKLSSFKEMSEHYPLLNDLVKEINRSLERVKATGNVLSFIWLKKLKDAVDDVDDIVNEYLVVVEKHEAAKHIVSKILFMSISEPFMLHYKVQVNIKTIKKTVDAIVMQINNDSASTSNMLPVGHPFRHMKTIGRILSPPNIGDASVVGRHYEKHHLISKLLETNNKIVSIIGLGGSGKTTLAKVIFNEGNIIEKHFDVRLWVHVSQEFHVKKIIEKICQAIEMSEPHYPLQQMRRTISDNLTGKRYLLVLDDVWNEDANLWEQLLEHLDSGAPGRSILLTTRSRRVAKMVKSTYLFDLPLLSDDDSWQLFSQSFGTAAGLESEFLKVGKQIVNRCRGVPLAIKVLAGVLCDKKLIEEWQSTSDLLDVETEETSVLTSLKVSYLCMPSQLKPCFIICSVFPKGNWIDKEQLIDQWICHDMITLEDGVDYLEHIGQNVFNYLVQMSFLQEVNEYNGRVRCRMHDLVHDLGRFVLGDEISLVLPKNATSTTKIYRYFSLNEDSLINPSKNIFTKARAIYVAPGEKVISGKALQNAKYLCSITIVGPVFKPISRLMVQNLRYLSISRWNSELLPEGISNIWSLQALHVTGSFIGKLPKSIGKLQKLRTLNLSGCIQLKSLPDSIGDCHMISSLDLSGCYQFEVLTTSIGRNKRLRVLRLGNTKLERLPTSITTLGMLECLDLRQCRRLVELPEGMCSLEKLQFFKLDGCDNLIEMPTGIRQLS